MKKRILGVLCTLAIVCSLVAGNTSYVSAAEETGICVDGSYLTHEESSTGYSPNYMARGYYLSNGNSIISRQGDGQLYAFGETIAHRNVSYLSVVVYVEQFNPYTSSWEYVTSWVQEAYGTYVVSTGKSISVPSGHYYRVRCTHFAGDAYPFDETASMTDGVWI